MIPDNPITDGIRTELTAVATADGRELVGMIAVVGGVQHSRVAGDSQTHRAVTFQPIQIGTETIHVQMSGFGPAWGYDEVNVGDEFVLILVRREQAA